MDLITLALDLAALVVILVGAFYALSLMRLMKGGKLSRSWMYIAEGWVVLASGQVAFSLESGEPQTDLALTIIGALLSIVGGTLMALGFREHLKTIKVSLA